MSDIGSTMIRRARPDEVELLRSLVVESMGHWGRDPLFLAEAARLMSLSADDLARDEAFALTVDDEVAAYCRVSLSADGAEIEELHVRPRWIGRGFGRALFEHAAHNARQQGAAVLRWTTDRYAAGFYRRMGGRVVGSTPSGIREDEPLTVMELSLSEP